MAAVRGLYTKRFALDRETPTDYGIDNATWITGRNAANTADVNMIRVNSSNEVEVVAGVSTLVTKLVTLTAQQVKALRATPITLVAAPGAGKMLDFVSAQLLLDYGGSNVFSETADNLAIRYTDGSGSIVSEAIETTGFIDQNADTKIVVKPATSAALARTACENKALVLHNTGDGEIAGNAANNNVVRALVTYWVHSTGW